MIQSNYSQQPPSKLLEPNFENQDKLLNEIRESFNSSFGKQGKTEAISFPLKSFPVTIQEIITATNESLRFPIDFTGTSMICAAATAIGNSFNVSVMENWQESPVLYAALVAPPGSNKSHPLTFAFEPLTKLDDKSYHQFVQERSEYDLVQNLNKKQRELATAQSDLKEPILSKFLVSDTTIEALIKTHKNNLRGICVNVDELAGFIKNINRYNSGGETEFWLSVWSGKTVNVDRVSQMPIRVKRPFIPIIGTIQNGVLFQLSKDGKGDNGFIDRILFALPQGIKKESWSEVKLNPEYAAKWKTCLLNLLEIKLNLDEYGNPIPRSLKFTNEAWKRIKEWQSLNTDLVNSAESEALQGVYSKLELYTIRFSLILQLMAWSCSEAERKEIELPAVEGAIMLTEYFRETAKIVHRIISKEDPLDRLDNRKKEVFKNLPEGFTTAEGLKIAEDLKMPERTFKDFLKNKTFFIKASYGNYNKQF